MSLNLKWEMTEHEQINTLFRACGAACWFIAGASINSNFAIGMISAGVGTLIMSFHYEED
ncbi:MAG: hypothetical protein ABEK36_04575 [Candidatus Aenigmatarchaeota archaeon]